MRNEQNDLIGIQKSKSGSINIKILEQAIDEVRFLNQIDGNIFPENDFPRGAKKLRGFDWRGEERPNSVEDLFKDDPPLVLPKISGLEDYVPPENFVDDSVAERVEAAGKETPNKPNKAARNLPKKSTVMPLKPKVKEIEGSEEETKKEGQ
jgi:hypothetical protein